MAVTSLASRCMYLAWESFCSHTGGGELPQKSSYGFYIASYLIASSFLVLMLATETVSLI